MTPRIGSLFSGSGMLDEGVRSVLGGEVAWHAEVDPAACKVLAYRYPGVPNLGDITAVDWAAVEPVDVITGGSPCQDVSHAGKRAGMRAGTRSGLWARMCDAIESLRPSLVVWENVRGVLSAEADSALEPCPGCVGDGDDGAVLRALGRVLGDLAELGYDTSWHGLRAADVGAPHGRFRVFVVATDARHGGVVERAWEARWLSGERPPVGRESGRGGDPASDAGRLRGQSGRVAAPGQAQSRESLTVPSKRGRVDAPANVHGDALRVKPVAVPGGSGATVDGDAGRSTCPTCGDWVDFHDHGGYCAGRCGGTCTDPDLGRPGWDSPEDYCPTCGHAVEWHYPDKFCAECPDRVCRSRADTAPDDVHARCCHQGHRGESGHPVWFCGGGHHCTPADTDSDGLEGIGRELDEQRHADRCGSADVAWGQYEPAIRRWETVLGRPAPAPTEPGMRGGKRLSPRLTEWMMGWPDGWVTDAPGISRNEALKICGNGVVPQQAAEAIRRMLSATVEAVA